jgi:hypothetical protein
MKPSLRQPAEREQGGNRFRDSFRDSERQFGAFRPGIRDFGPFRSLPRPFA